MRSYHLVEAANNLLFARCRVFYYWSLWGQHVGVFPGLAAAVFSSLAAVLVLHLIAAALFLLHVWAVHGSVRRRNQSVSVVHSWC